MKNYLQRTASAVAICSLFAFSACDSEEVSPDAALQATNTQDARSNKALNLQKTYVADLMPLNDSGVMGTATLTLDGDMLTVHIEARGLEPNNLHPQHIHGFVNNNKNSVCPPPSADTNGDGFIDVGEGAPFYGPILLPLEISPTSVPNNFPTASNGTISYTETFNLSENTELLPLQNNVIVLHGKTVEGLIVEGQVTGETYALTLPVACGQIRPANGKMK